MDIFQMLFNSLRDSSGLSPEPTPLPYIQMAAIEFYIICVKVIFIEKPFSFHLIIIFYIGICDFEIHLRGVFFSKQHHCKGLS